MHRSIISGFYCHSQILQRWESPLQRTTCIFLLSFYYSRKLRLLHKSTILRNDETKSILHWWKPSESSDLFVPNNCWKGVMFYLVYHGRKDVTLNLWWICGTTECTPQHYTLSPSFIIHVYLKMIIVRCFNHTTPLSSRPERVVFNGSLLVALKKTGLLVISIKNVEVRLGADLEMSRLCRCSKCDHHWQPQWQSSTWWRSPPPCWCVLVAAFLRWSAGDF